MSVFGYATKKSQEVITELSSDENLGLNKKEVGKRRLQYGYNKILIKNFSSWHIFIRQFKSAFIYLLLGALLITIVLGEAVDSIMILIFLIVNTGLGFLQEYRSEKTVQLLNEYVKFRSKVIREGKIKQIYAEELVPGDIIILQTGDKVPADCRLLEADGLSLDEAVLTGESVPVVKEAKELKNKVTAIYEAGNLIFSGTNVVKGDAKAIVLTTAQKTAYGRLAKLTGEVKKLSNFEIGISNFSRFVLKLIAVTLTVVFLGHLLIKQGNGTSVWDLLVFIVALTVSAIPEALPLVMTFSMSKGARNLAKKKVIVKRLSAIEDFGGIEVLCSDKTGTLTKNKLTVANVFCPEENQVLWHANLAAAFEIKKRTEPFDVALQQSLTLTQKKKLDKARKIAELSFDPQVKRNAVLVETEKKKLMIVRGASETVINLCSDLDGQARKKIMKWILQQESLGYRVLAIAYKEVDLVSEKKDFGKLFDFGNFNFSGLVSFVDPIKSSAIQAIKKAKQLGVRLVILTGDSAQVAGAVACKIGLIDTPTQFVTGAQWQEASEKQKDEWVDSCQVFARVCPEDKFNIVKAFRKKYTTGFLGDGINDAPALKASGISIVVDSASDIAREASDIILLQKNLKIIVAGIEEGRKVFANTIKYIKVTLSSNLGNFFAIACASLLIEYLPMLSIQILLVNLLSDTPMIAVSADKVDAADLRSPKKYNTKSIIIFSVILGVVSTVFDFIFFGLFYRISPGVLQTNWFIGSVLTELALLYSIRSKTIFFKASRPSSFIVGLTLFVAVLTVSLPYSAFGQNVFKLVAPTTNHLFLIFGLVIVYFIISEAVKLIYYKQKRKKVLVLNLKNS